ncbi:hypothetical protein V6N12_068488 [Hibiscus sabdariffa]|uniref:Uncharacterized protein n=1 Tax=Hibiscus sabdariffa TaxID=183260 RepID=A0ABR2FQV1_9ROSI
MVLMELQPVVWRFKECLKIKVVYTKFSTIKVFFLKQAFLCAKPIAVVLIKVPKALEDIPEYSANCAEILHT